MNFEELKQEMETSTGAHQGLVIRSIVRELDMCRWRHEEALKYLANHKKVIMLHQSAIISLLVSAAFNVGMFTYVIVKIS